MKHSSRSADEYNAITDAAAHWCLRLQAGDCTTAERLAFEQWLAADALHAREYQAMLDIWQSADQLPREARSGNLLTLPAPPHNAWRHIASAAVVAMLALPVGGWIGWEQGWLPSSYQHVQSTRAISHVVLGDGSEVELNLDSELRFTNYKDRRRVTLIKGEAFFKVRQDSRHPFIVHAAQGQTLATGTQFNVWKYEDQVKVTLVEGSVLVSSNASKAEDGYRLGPGMQASYNTGEYEPRVSQTYAQDSSLSWRNGKLILDNLSLAQALPQINRYLEKPLMLADETTGSIRISGIYDTRLINHLVSNLPKVLPVYLTRNKDGSMILNRISPPPARG